MIVSWVDSLKRWSLYQPYVTKNQALTFLLEVCQFVKKKNVVKFLSNVHFFNMKETEYFSHVYYLPSFLWK